MSVRVGLEGLRPALSAFPRPVALTWAEEKNALDDAELFIEEEQLTLRAFGGSPLGPEWLAEHMFAINQPASVELEDGSLVTARFAHANARGALKRQDGSLYAGAQIELDAWSWTRENMRDLVLFSPLSGRKRAPGHNLLVQDGSRWNSSNLRLEGQLNWHILSDRKSAFLLGAPPSGEAHFERLLTDLMVMDFVAGQSLDVQALWYVDPSGKVVGGIGTGRPRPTTYRRRSPVPNGVVVEACWAAPMFRSVVEALAKSDVPVTIALAGYMDGLRGHLHSEYLLGQVALEAFCRKVTPKEDGLVRSVDEWRAWISDHQAEIEALATSKDAAAFLLSKLNHNVFQGSATKVVQKAFESWGVPLPKQVLREVSKRNPTAHEYVMFDEDNGDVQEAADRVSLVQTLLAAAVAKHVGYTGPISGWETDRRGEPTVPEFWPFEDLPEARRLFICSR
jgi:hypothetical protein